MVKPSLANPGLEVGGIPSYYVPTLNASEEQRTVAPGVISPKLEDVADMLDAVSCCYSVFWMLQAVADSLKMSEQKAHVPQYGIAADVIRGLSKVFIES